MYNFDDAKVETGSNYKYITPGIEEVTITAVKADKNSLGNPVIDITVANNNNATCNNRYSLSTTVKPGSTKSAWDITKNQLFELFIAAGNTEEKVKSKLANIKSNEELAEAASALIVGKRVRMKFKGEERPGKDGKSNWILAKFAGSYFVENISASPSKLRFNPEKDIKYLPKVENTASAAVEDWNV